MVVWVLWCAPNGTYTKLPTSALFVIVWAVHRPPSMTLAFFNDPSVILCMFNSRGNIGVRVFISSHDSIDTLMLTVRFKVVK